jgi:hypothetical protein
MFRRLWFVVIAALAVLVGCLTPTFAVNNGRVPEFIISCPFSHRAADDPIEFPGQPGGSDYTYDFFGNTTTNANSTLSSLLAGPTTCDFAPDTAAYYSPTVFDNGKPLTPLKATIYYRNVGSDISTMQVFPSGFQMVGGNDDNSTHAAPGKMTGWACRNKGGLKGVWTQAVPSCASDQDLVFRVQFPECWDGQLDSADHRSHVARILRANVCPSSHPILIPRVSMTVSFDSRGGPGITIGSESPVFGAHMDFINSWDQSALNQLVQECLMQTTTKCRFASSLPDE